MKTRLKFVVVFGLLLVSGIDSIVHAQQTDWTPEQQAVIDAVKNGPMGIESDFDTWASGYADNWTYWRVGDRDTRPREAHMVLVREFIDAGNRPITFKLEPIDVIIWGDVALLRLVATEGLQSPEGEQRDVHYASAAMLKKVGERWQMLATNIVYLD